MQSVQAALDGLMVYDDDIAASIGETIDAWLSKSDDQSSFAKTLEIRVEKLIKEGDFKRYKIPIVAMRARIELRKVIAAHRRLEAIFEAVCSGKSPETVTTADEISQLFVWGPVADMTASCSPMYRGLKMAKLAGGPAEHMRGLFVAEMMEELDRVFGFLTMKAETFRIVLSRCLDSDCNDWPWIVEMVKTGEVAIMTEAELKFTDNCGLVLSGRHVSHPLKFKRLFGAVSSSRVTDEKQSSTIVRVWPGGKIVRTVNRFYLLPDSYNSVKRVEEVLEEIRDDHIYETIKTHEVEAGSFRSFSKGENDERDILTNKLILRHRSKWYGKLRPI